jgi:hypothetical protein
MEQHRQDKQKRYQEDAFKEKVSLLLSVLEKNNVSWYYFVQNDIFRSFDDYKKIYKRIKLYINSLSDACKLQMISSYPHLIKCIKNPTLLMQLTAISINQFSIWDIKKENVLNEAKRLAIWKEPYLMNAYCNSPELIKLQNAAIAARHDCDEEFYLTTDLYRKGKILSYLPLDN